MPAKLTRADPPLNASREVCKGWHLRSRGEVHELHQRTGVGLGENGVGAVQSGFGRSMVLVDFFEKGNVRSFVMPVCERSGKIL